MRPIIIAFALQLAAVSTIGLATYETRYTDASGARCVAFRVASREFDACTGLDDRPSPMPPATYPADWSNPPAKGTGEP